MSAQQVEDELISFLLATAMYCGRHTNNGSPMYHWMKANGEVSVLTPTNSKETGQMLKQENNASREWAHELLIEPLNNPSSNFTCENIRPTGQFRAEAILKAADYCEYQSSQHPGLWNSDAKEFIDCLRRAAWMLLPEYREAPWGTPDHAESFYDDKERNTKE